MILFVRWILGVKMAEIISLPVLGVTFMLFLVVIEKKLSKPVASNSGTVSLIFKALLLFREIG